MPSAATFPSRILYIAKEQGTAPNEYKAGRTRQLVAKRIAAMGGQTDSKFKLLEVFHTLDELTAETRAFEILDAKGIRKHPNTTKELFVGSYDVIRAACRAGCRYADELYRLRGYDKVDAHLATLDRPQATVFAGSKFWQVVLQTPIQHDSKVSTLGALVAAADKSPKALHRLEKLGVLRIARGADGTELRVVWHKAAWLVEWLVANRIKLPRSATSVFKVTHAR